ncbi:MAG: hypothetical protein LBF78_07120 [Treponema sp.]|jgi:hypothetical protein|nr:hypothetical protein [Treponema sp.]
MSDQEIKAWSLLIAATLFHPVAGEEVGFNAEFMDWLKATAKPIAEEIRKTTD